MSRDRIRHWANRTYYDPEPVLVGLTHVAWEVSKSDLPARVRNLRSAKLKGEREGRDALLFAHGMASVVGRKVLVSPGEVEDCDFLTKVCLSDEEVFSCVQLKELVDEDLSPAATLADLIATVNKRPMSDAVLAIRLNRRLTMPLAELAAIRVPFNELWFFWAATPDSTRWRLFGDAMGSPSLHEFGYPGTASARSAS